MTEAEMKKVNDLAEKVQNRVREYLKMVLLKKGYFNLDDNPANRKRSTRNDTYYWNQNCSYYKGELKLKLCWILGHEFDIPEQVIRDDFNWSLDDQVSVFESILDFYLINKRRPEPTDILFGQIVTLISNNVVNDLIAKGMALKTKRSKEYLEWCRK